MGFSFIRASPQISLAGRLEAGRYRRCACARGRAPERRRAGTLGLRVPGDLSRPAREPRAVQTRGARWPERPFARRAGGGDIPYGKPRRKRVPPRNIHISPMSMRGRTYSYHGFAWKRGFLNGRNSRYSAPRPERKGLMNSTSARATCHTEAARRRGVQPPSSPRGPVGQRLRWRWC